MSGGHTNASTSMPAERLLRKAARDGRESVRESSTTKVRRDAMNVCKSQLDGVANAELLVWQSEMSDAVAHLASAYAAIQRLDEISPCGPMAIVPFDLACQSVRTALVSLEECSLEVWSSSGENRRGSSAEHHVSKWQWCLWSPSGTVPASR